MKTAGVVLLLLWSGQVVIAAHNPDVKTTNTGKDAAQQSDIHTVLREMSNLIAQQGEQLKCTKTKLEDVEKKAEAMENRLRASESRVNQLKTENKAQSAAVSDLKRERARSRVSFSAALLGEGARAVSGVDTLVFQLPITNIGNGYNHKDGKFRAPIRGVYWFAVYLYGYGVQHHGVGATLQKNGEQVAIAYSHQPNYVVSTSNGASLLLEKGDEVWVKLWPGTWVYDNRFKHTTFSGHLLFAM